MLYAPTSVDSLRVAEVHFGVGLDHLPDVRDYRARIPFSALRT
jgi:hypothetical protein